MLLRSLTKHVKDQNWFAVFLDFFIVVAGILIAFQITNWNDERSDRRDEQAILRALHLEIVEADALTANIIDYRTSYIKLIADGTNVLFGLAPDRPLTESECTALANSNSLYFGRVDLPALLRLQSTGRLDIVSDNKLNNALAQLIQRREALENIMKLEEQLHDMPHLYPDIFRMRSTLDPRPSRKGGLERSLEATCDKDSIKSNVNLMNDIANNADLFDAFVRDGLGPWLEQMEELHTQLDRVLDISHSEEP